MTFSLSGFRQIHFIIIRAAFVIPSMCCLSNIDAAPARVECRYELPASAGIPDSGEQLCIFSVFQGGTAADADSGLLIYSETAQIQPANGAVNHVVGTGKPVFGEGLSAEMFRTSQEMYIQLAVGDARKIVLPRRLIHPVPYALNAENSESLGGRAARDYMLLEDYKSAQSKTVSPVPGTGVGSTIGGGSFNNASGDYSTVSGGYANTASGRVSTIGGGQGHQATGANSFIGGGYFSTAGHISTVGGGQQNQAFNFSTVAGGFQNFASGLSSSIGGGALNVATGERAVIAGGLDNKTSGTFSAILGGTKNIAGALSTTVSGGEQNTASQTYSTVGGGFQNQSTGAYATIPGGVGNKVFGEFATAGGGDHNEVNGIASVIAGGQFNETNAVYATIAGGETNDADGSYSTVGGGLTNKVTGAYSTVPGGNLNSASGGYSFVAGGISNTASGSYSFAAGRRAKAIHHGAFVWTDSTDADYSSVNNDTFTVRAYNGAKFSSGGDNTILAVASGAGKAGVVGRCNAEGTGVSGICNIGANGKGVHGTSTTGYAGYFSGKARVTGDLIVDGTINPPSDRNVKTDFAEVDSREVLRRLLEVKIESWKYRADKAKATHIGPMAQDFSKAFEVGADDKHISTIDADGVALAAIQGLHEELLVRDEKLKAQRDMIEKQQEMIKKQNQLFENQQKLIEELKTRVDSIAVPAAE